MNARNSMKQLDPYLPVFDFMEAHSCTVAASPSAVMKAVMQHQLNSDPFSRAMTALREGPMRLGNVLSGKGNASPEPFGLHEFVLLESKADESVVYGLIGRFWRPDFGLVRVTDCESYLQFNKLGVAKLTLGFSAVPLSQHHTLLSTETRVYCPNRACFLKFAPYWYLIRPVSGLIRRRILASIKKASERTIPGGLA